MKILKILAVIIVMLLPFSTVLSNFSPYWTSNTFQTYLLASLVFAIVCVLLGFFISQKGRLFSEQGIWFFLGILVAPPLMLGPPEISPKLLELTSEEHFRYGMLMVAVLVFALGFLLILKNTWENLSAGNKLIIIPFVVCVVLMIWDNYSSYMFSSEMKSWISSGKKAEEFAMNFDFNELYRTFGRTLLYVLAPWIGFILLKKNRVKTWQILVLSIFCSIGIVFFFLTNLLGMEYYFPFMVPAIALAPAYWLGIAMITKKGF